MTQHIAVIGAGAWGTALAKVLAGKGFAVRIWAYEAEVAEQINATRENPVYLPGIVLPKGLTATPDLADAATGASHLLVVCPSHVLRQTMRQVIGHVARDAILINASKGIEADSGKLISQILEEVAPRHAARTVFLSGPSFATEVAQERPTAVVLAARDHALATAVQQLFRTPWLMTFCHGDVIGVQVGGAMKNVIAIAAGIVDGLQLGDNTRAALLTRALYEMMKVGRALGGNPLTLVGLAGIGDLILTCTGDRSRNRAVGMALGQGKSVAEVTAGARTVAEGIATAKAVYQLIDRHRLMAPICMAVYRILYEAKPPITALNELLTLDLKDELGAILPPACG
ncbi:MAG: NAD(P)-dependent glycerol-3-phosphate dehydrogenase [Deltaproteobacteria bacterium]|nr:NAD(P)-dependent glycerol-3-phosphate dehydrogenase [Deltaproteobacteria bacterium]